MTSQLSNTELLDAVNALFLELIESQERRRNQYAKKINPRLTQEDLWQPHDFPELHNNPRFQYEDGQLTSLQAAHIAFRARIVKTNIEEKDME